MAEDYYELYQMRDEPELEQYRFRPYRYLQEHDVRVNIDLYACVLRDETQHDEKARNLRKRLEMELPNDCSGLCVNIGDVLAITKSGITEAFFVDPEKLILVPDFFYVPNNGALITIDTENCTLDGRKGSWMTVDSMMIDCRLYFLMQSLDYGRDAPYVVVDEQGKEFVADKKGFTDESIEQVRKAAAELAANKVIEQDKPTAQKPRLEVWQQYLENGEYLRAAEITEEQNYNMIDGTANNRTQRRSVLERLQEKQGQMESKTQPARVIESLNIDEEDRIRK